MDYEKKYKEAINVAQQHPNAFVHDVIEQIFPELSESEDEKIRKELISLFEDGKNSVPHRYTGDDCERWIAWLKSLSPQKEWKPSIAHIQTIEFILDYHAFAEPKRREILKELLEQLKAL